MAISNRNSLFHNVDLSLLRYFYDVATYGGFTKAARVTGTSQPALSLGVQKLEKALGKKLVRRGGKQFSLTEEGRELLQFCTRFEASLQMLVEGFGSDSAHRRNLRIGTALSIGFGPLLTLCERAANSERPLEVELTTQNTYDLVRAVAESQLDAALIPNDVSDIHLYQVPVLKDQITFVVGAAKKAAVSGPGWIHRTEDICLINYPRETPGRAIVEKICREKKLHFRRVFSVNSMEALKAMVALGVGGAFILRSLVLNELRSGMLIEPKQNVIRVKSEIALATRNDEAGVAISKMILELMGVT